MRSPGTRSIDSKARIMSMALRLKALMRAPLARIWAVSLSVNSYARRRDSPLLTSYGLHWLTSDMSRSPYIMPNAMRFIMVGVSLKPGCFSMPTMLNDITGT